MKLGSNISPHDIFHISSEVGHVRSKTRSRGQVKEKACCHSRSHIWFSSKMVQVCLKHSSRQWAEQFPYNAVVEPC